MEILIIIVGVLAIVSMIAFLVHLFIKAINKDQQEQDERILQLEKRIEEVKSIDKKRGQILDEAIGERIKEFCELENRIQKLERKKKSDNNDNNRK